MDMTNIRISPLSLSARTVSISLTSTLPSLPHPPTPHT
jgi:hypothetical protein